MIDEMIVEKVNKVFEDSFEIKPDKLKPEMRVFEDLGLDSLDIVDLVVSLQEEFGVKIRDDERIRNIRTLDDIYQFVKTLNAESVHSVPDDKKP